MKSNASESRESKEEDQAIWGIEQISRTEGSKERLSTSLILKEKWFVHHASINSVFKGNLPSLELTWAWSHLELMLVE